MRLLVAAAWAAVILVVSFSSDIVGVLGTGVGLCWAATVLSRISWLADEATGLTYIGVRIGFISSSLMHSAGAGGATSFATGVSGVCTGGSATSAARFLFILNLRLRHTLASG